MTKIKNLPTADDYNLVKQKTVQLVSVNWDDECRIDMLTGKGFEITEPAYVKKVPKKDDQKKFPNDRRRQKKDDKSYDGILSERFATEWGDNNAFQELYRCKCKHLKGKAMEGQVCDQCGTVVEYVDVDYEMFGYIMLNKYKIICPAYYDLLESVIGKTILDQILEVKYELDLDGQIMFTEATDNNPYVGKGMVYFYDHFEEILDFFTKKAKTKSKKSKLVTSDFIKMNKDKIFASCVPVYTSVLRPESKSFEKYDYYDINVIYNGIFTLSRVLYGLYVTEKIFSQQVDEASALYRIQKKVCQLYDAVQDLLKSKEGFIQQQILGGRIGWSSRCVIRPDAELKADEIGLPYLAFMELWEFEILGYIKEMYKITEEEAFHMWSEGCLEFDPKIYQIIEFILKKDKPMVVINRNPTINDGSMIPCNIAYVTQSESELGMSLNTYILKVLNADFDGDTPNVYAVKTNEMKECYDLNANPRKNFFISRSTGLFNTDMDLLKDESIGIYQFNHID